MSPSFKRFFSRCTALYFIAFGALMPAIAWAQRKKEEVEVEPEAEGEWLLPYSLVGLLVGLSMYSMCRPSVRRKKE